MNSELYWNGGTPSGAGLSLLLVLSQHIEMVERTGRSDIDPQLALLNAPVGLSAEAGELLDIYKKQIMHGHPDTEETREKKVKELGDIFWYFRRLLQLEGISFEEVLQGNLDKLNARYSNGFSTEASLARADEHGKELSGEHAKPRLVPPTMPYLRQGAWKGSSQLVTTCGAFPLSKKEASMFEILRHAADPSTVEELAQALNLKKSSVHMYLHRLRRVLGKQLVCEQGRYLIAEAE